MLAHRKQQAWQDALVARYPTIFKLTENGRTCTPGWPVTGDGWRDLIETAARRISEAVAAAPPATVTVVQIKQKYGTLRVYWHGNNLSASAEQTVQNAVALAEARSACSCETCGAPGVLHSRGDWLSTACSDHARGEPVPVSRGFENLHIVRAYDAGRYPIASCVRYVRETDSFIEVDPKSLGIEE